jgi:hypothetical protein
MYNAERNSKCLYLVSEEKDRAVKGTTLEEVHTFLLSSYFVPTTPPPIYHSTFLTSLLVFLLSVLALKPYLCKLTGERGVQMKLNKTTAKQGPPPIYYRYGVGHY